MTGTKPKESCANCKFWLGKRGQTGKAECVGGLPVPDLSSKEGVWPLVPPERWCGVWKPRPKRNRNKP